MNNKGQALVVFILILPIIIMLGAFMIDSGVIINENIKLNNVTENIVKETLKKSLSKEKVNNLIDENLDSVYSKKISIDDNKVKINIITKIKPIFGKIIGYKEYELESNIEGSLSSDKIIINKK